jgi:hypothetical protein
VTLLSLVAPESDASESPLPRFHIREWPEHKPLPESLSRFWKSPFTDTKKAGFSFGLVRDASRSDVGGGSGGTLWIRWIENNGSPEQLTLEEDIATWALDTTAVQAPDEGPTSLRNWTQSKSRWATLDKNSGSDADKEPNWLGIQPGKGGKATREFGKCDKDRWVWVLVAVLNAGPGREQNVNFNEVKKLLDDHWHESDPNKDKELSLLDWRGIVREYLRPSIESEFEEPRPIAPVQPPKGKDVEENQRREDRWRQQYKDWESENAKWKKREDTFVNEYFGNSRKLRSFLERRRHELSPEQVRAVEALVELDSLIVAKLRRTELKDELGKVTLRDAVGRLELELILPWIIAGEEEPIEVHAASVSGVANDTEPEGQTPQ